LTSNNERLAVNDRPAELPRAEGRSVELKRM